MKDDALFTESSLSHELKYDGKVLHLYKDDIAMPNGVKSTREYCVHGGAVAVVPLTADGEVICVRQYRYAMKQVMLEIPAGKLEYPNGVREDAYLAAMRELREETGFRADRLTPIGDLVTSPAILTEVIHLYLAKDLIPGETDFDEDEFIEIVKIPLDVLAGMIISGEVTDAKTQAAVMKVWAMKQKGLI